MSKKLNEMTISEAKEELDKLSELKKLFNIKEHKDNQSDNKHPYSIGDNYMIRTVTMTQVGKLVEVYDKELVLESAAWVADTGRLQNSLDHGLDGEDGSEIELLGKMVIVGRGSIVDCIPYNHNLPTKQK